MEQYTSSGALLIDFRLERPKGATQRWYPFDRAPSGELVLFKGVRNPKDNSNVTILRPNEMIGQGSFGVIYEGSVMSELQGISKPAVVKVTKFPTLNPPSSFKNEMIAHWILSTYPKCSDYITCMLCAFKTTMQLHGVYDATGSIPQKFFHCIVLEKMDGDAARFCGLVKKNVEDPEVRKKYLLFAAKQMADAVLKIHEEGFFHNDVKPSNFLYKWTGARYVVKIGDLGLACTMDKEHAITRIKERLDGQYGGRTMLHVVVEDMIREGAALQCTLAGTLKYMSREKQMAQSMMGIDKAITDMKSLFSENDVYGLRMSVNRMAVLMDLNPSEPGLMHEVTDCDSEFRLTDSSLRKDIARLEDFYGGIDKRELFIPPPPQPPSPPSRTVEQTPSQ
jgi:serine/threonine protein kinase